MTPTETLMHEHQIILSVIEVAEREARLISNSGRIQIDYVEKIIDFFTNFADRLHHAKEEKVLFCKLQERGMPTDSGPIAVMLQEHEEGRGRIKAILKELPEVPKGELKTIYSVSENLLAYTKLLRSHIDKEDNILYPMADSILTAKEQEELDKEFERVKIQEIGEREYEKYQKLAHDLNCEY